MAPGHDKRPAAASCTQPATGFLRVTDEREDDRVLGCWEDDRQSGQGKTAATRAA